jgi:hypothetical protein
VVTLLKELTEIAPRKIIALRLLRHFILLLLLTGLQRMNAQNDTIGQKITIQGLVRDEFDQPVSNVIIINKQTRSGSFGKSDGSFTIECAKTDTLAITSLGFHTRNICYVDSIASGQFYLKLFLETRTYRFATVEVFAPRDLENIQREIEQLGYNESDYMLSGINAVQSPITFLYQQFSKKEQSRRLAAQLENEDKKRELLKELFHHYVDYDIITLNNDEFDHFIDYLNVSDDFLKSSSQYDFLIYVKDRFKDYKIQVRQKKVLKEDDYNYDKD